MTIATIVLLIAMQQGPHWDALTNANNVASFCSVQEGVRLDDGHSSPDIVARGAMAACFRPLLDLDSAVKGAVDGDLPSVADAEREQLVRRTTSDARKRVEDIVIQAILERRKSGRAPNR